jgi:hypothetical protein
MDSPIEVKLPRTDFYSLYKEVRNGARRYNPESIVRMAMRELYEPVPNKLEDLRRAPWQMLLLVKWICQDNALDSRAPDITAEAFYKLRQAIWSIPERLERHRRYLTGLSVLPTASPSPGCDATSLLLRVRSGGRRSYGDPRGWLLSDHKADTALSFVISQLGVVSTNSTSMEPVIAGRVGDWRADGRLRWVVHSFRSGPQSGCHDHVSSPRHIERSVRFSRTPLTCLLHAKRYGTYPAERAFRRSTRTW